jgi:hypothetical protein
VDPGRLPQDGNSPDGRVFQMGVFQLDHLINIGAQLR